MNAVPPYNKINQRLTELEDESEKIINRYIDLAAISPEATVIKDLQGKLKAVRNEQFSLYEQLKTAA